MKAQPNQTPFFQLMLILFAYVMIGIAPLFIKNISTLSSFTIAFYRFFGGSMVELFISLLSFIPLKHALKRNNINVKYPILIRSCVKQYYTYPNPVLRGRSQLSYLILLGFCLVAVLVPTFYMGYILVGVILTVIITNSLTIVGLALINWIRREENMDPLKVVYLCLLIAAVITIGMSQIGSGSNEITIIGVVILFLCILAHIFYLMGISHDPSQRIPILAKVPGFTYRTPEIDRIVKFQGALFKLFAIHFFGSLLIIPLCVILYWVDPITIIGQKAGDFLLSGLIQFPTLIFNPWLVSLMFVCTAIPYFMVMYSSITWPKIGQKQDLWTSILSLMEPLVGLYLGYFVWLEPIRLDYILFTTLFIVATIVIRYFSETSNLKTFLMFVEYKRGRLNHVLEHIRMIKEVEEVNVLAGDYDICVKVTVHSMQKLADIFERIDGLTSVTWTAYTVQKSLF